MRNTSPPTEKGVVPRAILTLAQILIPGALVLVGLVLTKPYDRWEIAAAIVAAAVIASTFVALLLGRYYALRLKTAMASMETTIRERISDVTRTALMRADGREGWTQEKLSEYESRIDIETVWVIGEKLDNEITSDDPFLAVIERNVHERDICYVYIAPDEPELRLKLKRLREALELTENDPRLVTWLLEAERWQQMPYHDNFTIYDPVRKNHMPEGYFWDPGGDGKSFIKLRRDVVEKWVAKLQEVCPELDAAGQGPGAEETATPTAHELAAAVAPSGAMLDGPAAPSDGAGPTGRS
jgi:hypothetical protein